MANVIKRINGFFVHLGEDNNGMKDQINEDHLSIEEVIRRYEELCSR